MSDYEFEHRNIERAKRFESNETDALDRRVRQAEAFAKDTTFQMEANARMNGFTIRELERRLEEVSAALAWFRTALVEELGPDADELASWDAQAAVLRQRGHPKDSAS